MSTNGRLPASELATIPGTNRQVRADLVAQVAAFRAAFAHRFDKPLTVTDGYRPYSEQQRIFRARYTTTYLPGRPSRVWNGARWWQRPGTAQAAVPGTSNHGWGTALDLGSMVNRPGTPEWQWAVAHAPSFGFRWPREWAHAAGEWWHFEDGAAVPVSRYQNVPGAVSVAAPDLTLPDPLTPEDDMSIADIQTAIYGLWQQAAERSTPTGRNFARFITAVIVPSVWATTVARGDQQVPAIQELADAKTLAAQANARSVAILEAVSQIPGVDADALAATVAAAVGRISAADVADVLAARLAD